MARTPLLGHLLRQLRLVRAARAAGVTPDELEARLTERRLAVDRARRDRPAGAGPGRRDLLRGALGVAGAVGAAGAFGPLVGACHPASSSRAAARGGPRIAIVGAGIAGLHCAHRLAARGLRATVYEASGRVGGRIFTDRTTFAPQTCELGGELIDTGHRTMHRLAAELGIELLDYATDDPDLVHLTAHFGGAILTPAQLRDGFTPIAAAIDAALAGLRDPDDPGVRHDRPNGAEALDRLSLAAWLDAAGAAGPVRRLLEVAYTIEYGLEPDDSACLNLLLMISTDAARLRLFGESDERFRARGGNDAFVRGLAERLAPGQIELDAALEAIAPRGAGYRLRFARAAGGLEVDADRVVLALPFTRLRQLDLRRLALRPTKRRAIATLGYGTNAKLMVGFRGRPWRAAGGDGETYTDLGYQATWDTSRLQPGTAGLLTNFTGGAAGLAIGQGTPAERAAGFLAQLDRVVPGARADATGAVARFHWPSHPHTGGGYAAYRPGQYTAIAGVEGLIEDRGSLHFCGEHTSTEAQGYMEGGAESGARVAREIADALGLRAAAQTAVRAPRRPAQPS